MVKMGFKEGKGLGKEGQGMSTALQVERTSRRGGKIIHEKDLLQQQMAAQQAALRVQALISERTSNVRLELLYYYQNWKTVSMTTDNVFF